MFLCSRGVILLHLTSDLRIWRSRVSLLVPEPFFTHIHTQTHSFTATSTHPCLTPQHSTPNPQRTRYQLGWALLHQPDIHTGLEGGAAAGWKYRELWFTVRDTERIRIRAVLYSCLLFLSVCLCLCLQHPYMYVCVRPLSPHVAMIISKALFLRTMTD